MKRKFVAGSLITLVLVVGVVAALFFLSRTGELPIARFQRLLAPVETKSTLRLDAGKMEVNYLPGSNSLSLTYSADGEDHQLRFTTKSQQMGILVEVAGSRLTYSVKVLKKGKGWPPRALKGRSYSRRLNLDFPGWELIVVEGRLENAPSPQ